jgi:hypothetical protein
MVQTATKRGYTKTAMALANDQAARRADLERQREEAAGRLAALEVEQAGEREAVDAHGPSALFGGADQRRPRR